MPSAETDKLTIMPVRLASSNDIPACKAIADAHRNELGFIVAASFVDSVRREQLLVAEKAGSIVGFVRFNHRIQGNETALYDICVAKSAQRQGVGRLLVEALRDSSYSRGRRSIVLRCPENLPANAFYARLGFQSITVEAGRRRPLVLWRLTLQEA